MKLLTCLDSSHYSQSVTELTAWAAQKLDSSVHLLHVLDSRIRPQQKADFSGNMEPAMSEALLKEIVSLDEKRNRIAREQGRILLDNAADILRGKGVLNSTTEMRHGSLVEAVSDIEGDFSILIMGKRGEHADFDKLHLGSNLERVIRASNRPILVASRAFQPIRKFLIAYDGGKSIERAIDFALNQPLLKGMECALVRAGEINGDAEWFLQEAAGKLRDAGYKVDAYTVEGDPEKAISQSIASSSIDLLVMGAYGHSKIRNLVVGSTTSEMLRTCQVPVLMFR